MTQPLPTVGFVGTGIMGASMAGHLVSAGYPLHVFNRTRSKTEPLLAAGAVWCDSADDVAASADIVITIVGMPVDVEQVYFGADGRGGLVAAAKPGSLLIDMTTSSPTLAERIAEAATARGLASVDAPVSGGDVGARNGTLVIMAGGDEAAYARALPLFETMGKSITRLGAAGAGQRCKLANQVAVAVGMVAWCEALAHAEAGGLDASLVQQVISGGAAGSWAMTNLAPRALADDFAPGFLVRHLVKDIGIAREAADETGTELPGLMVAEQLYALLNDGGCGDEGTQALLRLYRAADDAAV